MGVCVFWPIYGNRSYWGIFDPLFSDNGYTGLESEITSFAGRKTGLIIPFWLADRRSDGLEQGENGKKACFDDTGFQGSGLALIILSTHCTTVLHECRE